MTVTNYPNCHQLWEGSVSSGLNEAPQAQADDDDGDADTDQRSPSGGEFIACGGSRGAQF
ncbi:hypothetical protein GCM10009763_00410 [Dermacoccus profundi]|uniref:Uncharacterized protein n=1 Tax=Dermacoccus profundi TaxID=322602 RepID=A0ABN2CC75_9MICO